MVRWFGVLVVVSLLGSVKGTSAQLDPLEVQKVQPNLFLLNGGSPGAATTVTTPDGLPTAETGLLTLKP